MSHRRTSTGHHVVCVLNPSKTKQKRFQCHPLRRRRRLACFDCFLGACSRQGRRGQRSSAEKGGNNGAEHGMRNLLCSARRVGCPVCRWQGDRACCSQGVPEGEAATFVAEGRCCVEVAATEELAGRAVCHCATCVFCTRSSCSFVTMEAGHLQAVAPRHGVL